MTFGISLLQAVLETEEVRLTPDRSNPRCRFVSVEQRGCNRVR
jgi:hypothetical protein